MSELCPVFEICLLVKSFLKERTADAEMPIGLVGGLHMISKTPVLLAQVRACVKANPQSCYLSLESEHGSTTRLDELFKPLQPK